MKHFREHSGFDQVVSYAGMEPSFVEQIFSEWAGIGPKEFLEYLTVEALKKEMLEYENDGFATGHVALSPKGCVPDLIVHVETVMSNEYKIGRDCPDIEYGFAASPFGECFIAWSGKGICAFQFMDNNGEVLIDELKATWMNTPVERNNRKAQALVSQIFSRNPKLKKRPLKLFLKGTPFQLNVWRTLLRIPFGKIISYSQLARLTGNVKATRAVASAVARNPIGYVVPCHRVIRNEGVIGQYRWKPERKALMIGWEKSALTRSFLFFFIVLCAV